MNILSSLDDKCEHSSLSVSTYSVFQFQSPHTRCTQGAPCAIEGDYHAENQSFS